MPHGNRIVPSSLHTFSSLLMFTALLSPSVPAVTNLTQKNSIGRRHDFERLVEALFLTRSYVHGMNLYSSYLATTTNSASSLHETAVEGTKLKMTAPKKVVCSSVSLLRHRKVRRAFEQEMIAYRNRSRYLEEGGDNFPAWNLGDASSTSSSWFEEGRTSLNFYPDFASVAQSAFVIANSVSEYMTESLSADLEAAAAATSNFTANETYIDLDRAGPENQIHASSIRLAIDSILKGFVESDVKIFGSTIAFKSRTLRIFPQIDLTFKNESSRKVPKRYGIDVASIESVESDKSNNWSPAVFKRRKHRTKNVTRKSEKFDLVEAETNFELIRTDIARYYDYTSDQIDRAEWFWALWQYHSKSKNITHTSHSHKTQQGETYVSTEPFKEYSPSGLIPDQTFQTVKTYPIRTSNRPILPRFARNHFYPQNSWIADSLFSIKKDRGKDVDATLFDDADFMRRYLEGRMWHKRYKQQKQPNKARIQNFHQPLRHSIKFVPKDLSGNKRSTRPIINSEPDMTDTDMPGGPKDGSNVLLTDVHWKFHNVIPDFDLVNPIQAAAEVVSVPEWPGQSSLLIKPIQDILTTRSPNNRLDKLVHVGHLDGDDVPKGGYLPDERNKIHPENLSKRDELGFHKNQMYDESKRSNDRDYLIRTQFNNAHPKGGLWSHPFIDCKLGKIWLVAFSVPLLINSHIGFNEERYSNSQPFYNSIRQESGKILIGVVSVFLDLRYLNVNECENGTGIFSGTHLCDETTQCIPVPGKGFTYGSYSCRCKNAFELLKDKNTTSSGNVAAKAKQKDETTSTERPSLNTFVPSNAVSTNPKVTVDDSGDNNVYDDYDSYDVSSDLNLTRRNTEHPMETSGNQPKLGGKLSLRYAITQTVKQSLNNEISQYYSLIPPSYYDRAYQGNVLEETYAHDLFVAMNKVPTMLGRTRGHDRQNLNNQNNNSAKVFATLKMQSSNVSSLDESLYVYTVGRIIRTLYRSLIDTDVHLYINDPRQRYHTKPESLYDIYYPEVRGIVHVNASTIMSSLTLGGMYPADHNLSHTTADTIILKAHLAYHHHHHHAHYPHYSTLGPNMSHANNLYEHYISEHHLHHNNVHEKVGDHPRKIFLSSIYRCFSCGQIRCTRCPGVYCFARYNPWIRCPPLAFQTFCMTATVALIVLIFKTRKIKIISYAMWTLLEMILLGAFILYSTVVLEFFNPTTVVCFISPWLREIGFGLMYGAIILKLYKLYVDFQSRKAHRIHVRDKDLLKYLSAIIVVLTGYMSAWTFVNLDRISEEGGSMLEVGITKTNLLYYVCKSLWWDYIIEIGEFSFLMFGLYYSWRIRTSKAYKSEIWALKISLCIEAFISSLMNLIRHLLLYNTHSDYVFLMQFLRTQLTVTVILFLIFYPKLNKLFNTRPVPGDKRLRGISTTEGNDYITPEAVKLRENLTSNGNIDFNDISISDMDPEEIRSELKRVYMQLQTLKNKNLRKDNPHISKRRGGRKVAHSRRFSLQAFHHHPQSLIPGIGMVLSHSSQDNTSTMGSTKCDSSSDTTTIKSSITKSIGSAMAQDMKNILTTHLSSYDRSNMYGCLMPNYGSGQPSLSAKQNLNAFHKGIITTYPMRISMSTASNHAMFDKISEGDEESEAPNITVKSENNLCLKSPVNANSKNKETDDTNKLSPHSPFGGPSSNIIGEESSAVIYEDATTTTTNNTTTSNSNIHGASTAKSSSSISIVMNPPSDNRMQNSSSDTKPQHRKSTSQRQSSQKLNNSKLLRNTSYPLKPLGIISGIIKKSSSAANMGTYKLSNHPKTNKLKILKNKAPKKGSKKITNSLILKNLEKLRPQKRFSESVHSELTQSNNNSDVSKTPDSSSN